MQQRREFIKTLAAAAPLMIIGTRSFSNPITSGRLAELETPIMAWLEEIRYKAEGFGRWPYNKHMYRRYALESSSFAINILAKFNQLEKLTSVQREEAIAFLQNCQNPDDGVFRDPLVKPDDHNGGNHTWEHIYNHMSGVAKEGLANLKAQPKYNSPAQTFADLGKVDVREWILSLNWENPWMVGEHFYTAVANYYNKLPQKNDAVDDQVITEAFATIEQEILDHKTGMPLKRGCTDKIKAMAGLFKIAYAYRLLQRPLPFADKAIDYVLAMQYPSGHFSDSEKPSNIIVNWDAMWLLDVINRQLENSYRFSDIKRAGNLHCDYLYKNFRKPDGAFSTFTTGCMVEHNSVKVSDPHFESDVNGTNLVLNSILYTDNWNSKG